MNHCFSWNNIPKINPTSVCSPRFRSDIGVLAIENQPYLVQGNARSYGDVCLNNRGTLIQSKYLDRLISFDQKRGVLRAESGITLKSILSFIVPQGWFLAVSPGTQLATLGGAIANDVHGKNHHIQGSFGHHVLKIGLLRSSGEILECSPEKNTELFYATIGGLGLTGVIMWADVQLRTIKSPWMHVYSQRFDSLEEYWNLNHYYEGRCEYVVSWIDCLGLGSGSTQGRGIIFAGDHITSSEKRAFSYQESSLNIPVQLPFSLVNKISLKVFNQFYYRKKTYPAGTMVHYIPYFYPLDSIQNWNRIYGKKGFYQYQCVLPVEGAFLGIQRLLTIIAKHQEGSFLAVLKSFGAQNSVGMLSFPREGVTLALDFPNRGAKTLELFLQLDRIVSEVGGALYPAKDARMPAKLFQESYPKWKEFSEYMDPLFSSGFWERVTK